MIHLMSESKNAKHYLAKYLFIPIIRFYQMGISPFIPPRCRFQPTCSNYAIQCFQKYSTIVALKKTIKRIAKCHPFHPGGNDPA